MRIPEQAFPELYSFTKKKNLSVHHAKTVTDLNQLVHLPMSAAAFMQLQTLLEALEHNANMDESDTWTYIWASHLFSSARAYKHLTGTLQVPPCYS